MTTARYVPAADIRPGDHLPAYSGDLVSVRETKCRYYLTIRKYDTGVVAEDKAFPVDKRAKVMVGTIDGVNGK